MTSTDDPLSHRPLRSLLYVPASNARAIEKARELPCDAVFLDLEDGVAPEVKTSAREAAAAAVAHGFGERAVVIRCNHHASDWGRADWAVAVAAGPDAILAPKIGSSGDVQACIGLMANAPARTRLWVMIETAKGVVNLNEIAAAGGDRLGALIAGTNDLMLDLRCRPTEDRAPLRPALAMVVATARANGLQVFDGVYNDFGDPAGFEAECRQAADFGFDGKTLIHPTQIETCNRVFAPLREQLDWARAVVEAFDRPEASGQGAISLDGKMLERLHLREARRLLASARH